MQGASDLAKSERGVFCIALVIVSAILVGAGKITGDAWMAYTQWIATVLVASKTVTGAIEMLRAPAASSTPTRSASIPEAKVVESVPAP